MAEMNRREFVERAAMAAGAVAASGLGAAQATEAAAPAIGKAKLGRTGIKPSLIGLGTGSIGWNHQSNQTRLGQERFTALIRHAYDNGITFFDAADQYGSYPYLREALRKIPRDQIVIQGKSNNRSPEGMRADVERFRKELGTDYIDTLLIHCVTEADWNVRYRGIMDVLEEARQKGHIRAHGCSCHTFEALETAAREPWVQVDLARFNPWGKYMDVKPGGTEEGAPATVQPVLQQMRRAGKGVIGMKILAQGDMARAADRLERARESIKFALGSKAIDAMVIGFESPQQVTEVLQQTRLAAADLGLRLA